MHIGTGAFHALKETGKAVWDLIDGARSLDEIKAVLAARYAIDAARCDADVTAFVAVLEKAGLVAHV